MQIQTFDSAAKASDAGLDDGRRREGLGKEFNWSKSSIG